MPELTIVGSPFCKTIHLRLIISVPVVGLMAAGNVDAASILFNDAFDLASAGISNGRHRRIMMNKPIRGRMQ